MNWSDCDVVESVPGKVSGVPLVRGTRVPAESVVENHKSGESIEDVAFNFDLKQSLIRKVLAYAAAHASPLRP